jgi:uncharacterized membrane protein YphA (DoxX/SURF4 family)
MSSSNRTAWALLLLRLAVGGAAVLQGFLALKGAHGAISFGNAGRWAFDLAEMIAGAFVLIGLWIPISAGALAVVIAWPLVHGWMHGAAILGNLSQLFRVFTTLACALGGAGKWGVGK